MSTDSRRGIPEQISEHDNVSLPASCPHCSCHDLTSDRVCPQYKTGIPRKPIRWQFDSTSVAAPAAANAYRDCTNCRLRTLRERRTVSREPICRRF